TARPTIEGLRKLPEPAASKIPQDPETLARVTAGVQIGGGLLLASGKLPRLASAALACSVIPGSLGGHLFWTEKDPERKAQQRRDFMTDLSLLGGLMIASVDTEGKPSLGWRGRRAAHRASEAVASALPSSTPSGSGLLETGRELAEGASERISPLLETARERGSELADAAVDRGTDWADTAKKRGKKAAKKARQKAQKRADEAA